MDETQTLPQMRLNHGVIQDPGQYVETARRRELALPLVGGLLRSDFGEDFDRVLRRLAIIAQGDCA